MGFNMKEKLEKIDTTAWGLIIGAILPIIGFYLSYIVKTWGVFPAISFGEYVDLAFSGSQHQQDILIFSLIPNMFLFYFSNFRWQLNAFTKGLVGITVVCLIVLLFLTF